MKEKRCGVLFGIFWSDSLSFINGVGSLKQCCSLVLIFLSVVNCFDKSLTDFIFILWLTRLFS